ncbi:hypothetical protein [Parendozoicomonas haliclonae]|uniref:Uncharacterized protein n=1 Tax=Parendozoicomonas haliclonae TaxID=1960125 RepID=A0A1X7AQB3_9GAMM|nr:hypothetical protein [Parendozoicomonas haliclonae]SMA50511.1 hypothetical protein EHSB41UT_04322 [Parendozoicomonas haliclonae]
MAGSSVQAAASSWEKLSPQDKTPFNINCEYRLKLTYQDSRSVPVSATYPDGKLRTYHKISLYSATVSRCGVGFVNNRYNNERSYLHVLAHEKASVYEGNMFYDQCSHNSPPGRFVDYEQRPQLKPSQTPDVHDHGVEDNDARHAGKPAEAAFWRSVMFRSVDSLERRCD